MKKVYLSADIEGTCGIVCWDETEYGNPRYEYFSRQMSREVAAACEGALAAGAEDILVRDAHDSARNIRPEMLPLQARIFRNWERHPFSMMSGIMSQPMACGCFTSGGLKSVKHNSMISFGKTAPSFRSIMRAYFARSPAVVKSPALPKGRGR